MRGDDAILFSPEIFVSGTTRSAPAVRSGENVLSELISVRGEFGTYGALGVTWVGAGAIRFSIALGAGAGLGILLWVATGAGVDGVLGAGLGVKTGAGTGTLGAGVGAGGVGGALGALPAS